MCLYDGHGGGETVLSSDDGIADASFRCGSVYVHNITAMCENPKCHCVKGVKVV